MSLKNLLAVGESFFGVSTEPNAYEVRKKYRLPVFGPPPESAEQIQLRGPEPAAGPEPMIAPQRELDFEARREARLKISPERSRIEKDPEERRKFLERKRRSGARRLTQAEMSLDEVEVMRNDLSDADLKLAPRRAARSGEPVLNPFAPRPIAETRRPAHEKRGWAARMARLFGFVRRGRP